MKTFTLSKAQRNYLATQSYLDACKLKRANEQQIADAEQFHNNAAQVLLSWAFIKIRDSKQFSSEAADTFRSIALNPQHKELALTMAMELEDVHA